MNGHSNGSEESENGSLLDTHAEEYTKKKLRRYGLMFGWILFGIFALVCFLYPIFKKTDLEKEDEKIGRDQSSWDQMVTNTCNEAKTGQVNGIIVLRCRCGHYDTRTNSKGMPDLIFKNYPNSVGGITFETQIVNCRPKTIKYCTFVVKLVNAVGDPASCEIGDPTQYLKGSGPVNFGETGLWNFKDTVYSRNVASLTIHSIIADYMDGSRDVFSGSQIILRNKMEPPAWR